MGQVGSLSYLPDKWLDYYELLLDALLSVDKLLAETLTDSA
jgi:hypothetical protein